MSAGASTDASSDSTRWEREYFVREQARHNGLGDSSPSADLLNAHVRSSAYGTVWISFFSGLGGGP